MMSGYRSNVSELIFNALSSTLVSTLKRWPHAAEKRTVKCPIVIAREHEQQLQILMEQASEAMLILGAATNHFMMANERALALFEIDRETLFSVGLAEMSPLKQANDRLSTELAQERIQQALDGAIAGFDWVYRTATDRLRPCYVKLIRFPAAGRKLIGVWITERADAPSANRADDLKSRLIAELAHDLTNPVSNFRLRLYILKNAPQRLTESISVMESLVDRMEIMAKELLTLSRLDSDISTMIAEPQVRDLSPLVREMAYLCAPMAESKGLTLKVETAPKALMAAIDEKPIERGIVNLISNAINYTPAGGTISVSTRQENDKVVLSVRDTGIGINPGALPYIFDRFYRSDEAKRTIEGSGLGLTIVKEIVQRHGGTIKVSSVPGKGSLFEIWLPVANPPVVAESTGGLDR